MSNLQDAGRAGPGPLPDARPVAPQAAAAMDHGGDAPVSARRGATWGRRVLPFASSLSLHAGVVAIGLLTARAIQVVRAPTPVVENQAFAATMDLQDTVPDGLTNPSIVFDDPTREFRRDDVPDVTAAGFSKTAGQSDVPKLDVGGEGGELTSIDTLIGAGDGRRRAGRDGPGAGPGGAMAPFGLSGGGGGPRSKTFEPVPAARTVAYVCDASGSMINTFPSLKSELTKAVSGLKGIQAFNIVFFQDERASAMTDGLVLATPQNKAAAFRFLDEATNGGQTNPIPGIELAFRSKPQLVYLLTDADFPDNRAVLAAIRRLNASKQTKVNTIAFVSGDEGEQVSQGFVDLMKTIAQENGGTFRIVKERDLQ